MSTEREKLLKTLDFVASAITPQSELCSIAAAFIRKQSASHDALVAALRDDVKVMNNLLAYLRKHADRLPPMTLANLEARITLSDDALAAAGEGA